MLRATRFLDDDVIEAIVDDRPVEPAHASLRTFARSVRALGDGPAPRASAELVALLEHGLDAVEDGHVTADAPVPPPAPRPTRLAGVAARVAGLGIVGKVALGSSLAAAGVGAAGAVGVLPAAANDTVRHAIESVLPVAFDDRGDAPDTDGSGPPSTRPGDGDEDGSGGTVADDATGADHRPDPGAADEPPGQSGETGLTRADDTPAEPHAPDTTPAATAPSTVPDALDDHASDDAPDDDHVPGA